METVNYRNPELTLSSQTLYSSSRRNIMPAIVQPDIRSGPSSRGEVRASSMRERGGTIPVNRPKTATELIEWSAGPLREPGQSPLVENARKGIAVREFRERFADAEDQAKQKINAALGDPERVIEAGRQLKKKGLLQGEKLNETQEKALLKAHYAKDPFEKVKLLRKAGFDRNQTRELIESHLAGMTPPTRAGVSPDYDNKIQAKIAETASVTFTDPELGDFARKIGQLYGADYLDRDMLMQFYGDVRKHAVEGGDLAKIAEAKILQEAISQTVLLDDLRTGKGDPRGRDYATEVAKNEDFKARIDAEADPHIRKELEKQRKEFIRGIASSINLQGQGQYDPLFEIIIEEGNSFEYLINRIVSAPLDSETGDWDLGFYGNINLNTITNILRTQKDNLVVEGDPVKQAELRASRNVQYQSALEIEEAIRLAHDVNKSIINTDLTVFGKIAGSLTDGMLARLSKVRGVGVVGRLLEAEHGNLVARDTRVNSNNYAVMMGKSKDPDSGLLSTDQERSAIASFKELVEKAKARVVAEEASGVNDPTLTAEMRELGQFEDWQITWAFNIGKTLYNMSLRSAEWISQGKVPKGDKGLVSFPQESIARILNWPQWMLQRFGISESRGGTKFLENAIKIYQGTREADGYGEMGLAEIGGKKVENFEMPDMIGVRGWWASWRGRQLIMETIPIQFRPRARILSEMRNATVRREGIEVKSGDITDLGVLLDGGITVNDIEFEKLSDSAKANFINSVFLDEEGYVRADFNRGLGASLFFGLKPSAYGHHPDGPEYTAAKEHIRTLIWEKAAIENPLGVIPFLHGLKYKNGHAVKIMPGQGSSPEDQLKWQNFSRKLFQLNELKMQKIKALDPKLRSSNEADREQAVGELEKITLESIIAEEAERNISADQKITFNDYEIEKLRIIREEGRRAAPHLANVRFSYNPFLNDLSLEKIDYGIVGQEGYRRMLNDTSGFQGANDALIKIMDNPSKYKEPEELFEAIKPFQDGIGPILGTDVGQRKGYLWLEGMLDMLERGSNATNRVSKRLRQFTPFSDALKFLHVPNSKAQVYAGHHAAAFNAQELFKAGEEALHAGVISEEEENKWRKRFGGHQAQVLKGLLRFLLAGVLVAGIDIPKRSAKDLKM